MLIRCPRCKASLREQEYEGHMVKFCAGCFGHWLKRDQLDDIVNTVAFKFSKHEADSLLGAMTLAGDENRLVDENCQVRCPECDGEMKTERYHPNCPVRIDVCAEHGVWLDTGEIKDLQVFVEQKVLGITHA
jgi:Zn-finger nucleic acid-binding protein